MLGLEGRLHRAKMRKTLCLVSQLCLTLCEPMACYHPPGSSVHGILQGRILEWVSIPFPEDLPDPGIKARSALQADSLLYELQGSLGRILIIMI